MAAAYKAARDKRAFYETQRDSFNDSLPKCDPAKFIFLNATCWNGLWRTNSSKKFNVPFGAPKTDDVMPSPDSLSNASAALQHADLRAASWKNVISTAGTGDFVFLDPPYFSDIAQNGTKYGAEEWGFEQHRELAEALLPLHSKGARFILTNSGELEMEAMYKELGLTVQRVLVARAINSKTDERKPVGELVVTNPTETRSVSFGKAELDLLALD
jgi:DNA adenine methylase